MLSTHPSADILSLFQAEAGEHLQLLGHELLQLERDPSGRVDALKKILRAAHSLKGTAAAAGLTGVERLTHNFESCMQVLAQLLAENEGELDPATVDLLYRLLDAIEGEIVRACGGELASSAVLAPQAAELRARFGEQLALYELSDAQGEDSEPVALAARNDEGALLRVATGKVDRLMANVEELVQVKASGAHVVADLGRLAGQLQTLTRELARGAARQQRGRQSSTVRGSAGEGIDLGDAQRRAEQGAELCAQLELALRRHSYRLNVLATRLQDDIRAVRMVPARAVFAPFSRTVRDLGRRLDKQVMLRVEGETTEIDRDLLETLREPVLHLLRNAVAHGIETPEQRRAAGKPLEGTVRLQIASHAAGLEIGVQDDGRGIDLERVRALAAARGVDVAQLADADLERFIFHAGFSTAASVDAVSGRGVGLDVVRDVVERAGGSVRLEHVRGVGTRFVLRMPPSLTTMRVLVVRAGGSALAVPVSAIGRIVRVDRDAVRQVNSGSAIEIEGRAVPLARLATLLELGGSATALDRVPAVVVGSAAERCTLVVDAIDGEQELVVTGLGDYLRHNPNIAGASVLSGGEIVPVLNVAALVRRVAQKQESARVFEPRADQSAPRKRVLIVDDSITTRTLEKSILEAVGYAVEVATDGVDALQKLRAQRFDLMLSDVQMPRMDGVELVTRVRADSELRRLKVVLVSSLNAGDDRKRGLTAGADAYIGKNEFRQDLLLQTLERLL